MVRFGQQCRTQLVRACHPSITYKSQSIHMQVNDIPYLVKSHHKRDFPFFEQAQGFLSLSLQAVHNVHHQYSQITHGGAPSPQVTTNNNTAKSHMEEPQVRKLLPTTIQPNHTWRSPESASYYQQQYSQITHGGAPSPQVTTNNNTAKSHMEEVRVRKLLTTIQPNHTWRSPKSASYYQQQYSQITHGGGPSPQVTNNNTAKSHMEEVRVRKLLTTIQPNHTWRSSKSASYYQQLTPAVNQQSTNSHLQSINNLIPPVNKQSTNSHTFSNKFSLVTFFLLTGDILSSHWRHSFFSLATFFILTGNIFYSHWQHFLFSLATFFLLTGNILYSHWQHSFFSLATFFLLTGDILSSHWRHSFFLLATFFILTGNILSSHWQNYLFSLATFFLLTGNILYPHWRHSFFSLTTFWYHSLFSVQVSSPEGLVAWCVYDE